ncbi:hypothetical protein C3Y87_11055 [Carbonactinospora thermoautotrophica]|nr:hypothetical protein [Carbonactinospora thermoautotrophica]
MPEMLRSLASAVRRAPGRCALGVCVFVAITGYMAWDFLVLREPWQLLVDLDVYRDAGVSVLIGRPIYHHFTATPQLLPFTYPPIAALFAIPLALLPLRVLGWLWTAMQFALLAGIVGYAFRPFLTRFGRWQPVALGALAGGLMWIEPLRDGVMFGQVNVILIALVLADYVAKAPRWPRGMLIGIATAVKLTPGVFILHLWFSGRRREAITAAATATGCTLLAFLVVPVDSADFWFRALLDSERLGPNAGTSNQSIRGMLMRLHVDNGLLWLALCALIGFLAYRYAVRCSRIGHELGACAIVGLLAVLLSPVAWIHHLAWIVPGLGVIVGDGRNLRRLLLMVGTAVYFILPIPWWGAELALPGHPLPEFVARVIEDAFGLAAIALIPLIARYALHDTRDSRRAPGAELGQPARPAKAARGRTAEAVLREATPA